MTTPLVTSEIVTKEQGRALFDSACRRHLNVPGPTVLAALDDGSAWDLWGHDVVSSLLMLAPFAR